MHYCSITPANKESFGYPWGIHNAMERIPCKDVRCPPTKYRKGLAIVFKQISNSTLNLIKKLKTRLRTKCQFTLKPFWADVSGIPGIGCFAEQPFTIRG